MDHAAGTAVAAVYDAMEGGAAGAGLVSGELRLIVQRRDQGDQAVHLAAKPCFLVVFHRARRADGDVIKLSDDGFQGTDDLVTRLGGESVMESVHKEKR